MQQGRELVIAKINYRAANDVSLFINDDTKASILMKERQPIASSVLVNSTLAENRDLSFAHPNLNEGGLDVEPSSDDSCIDAEGALFKLHYGHSLRCGSETPPRSSIFSVSPCRPFYPLKYYKVSWIE